MSVKNNGLSLTRECPETTEDVLKVKILQLASSALNKMVRPYLRVTLASFLKQNSGQITSLRSNRSHNIRKASCSYSCETYKKSWCMNLFAKCLKFDFDPCVKCQGPVGFIILKSYYISLIIGPQASKCKTNL